MIKVIFTLMKCLVNSLPLHTMCEQMEASPEAHRPYGSETSVDQRFLAMLGTLQEEPG